MTLGKHKAHVLKLRYRNTSNFEDSALPYRGGKRMDLAPALCGVAGPPHWSRSRRGQGRRNLAAEGFLPPPDSRRRCRRNLAAAAAGFLPVTELSAGFSPPLPPELSPWPVSRRRRIPAAWAPASVAPGWPAGCTTWCRAHPADLSLEVVLFWGRMCFVVCGKVNALV